MYAVTTWMVQTLTGILVGTNMEEIQQTNLKQTTKQTTEQCSAPATAMTKEVSLEKAEIQTKLDKQQMKTEKSTVADKKEAALSVKQTNAKDLEIEKIIGSKLCMALGDLVVNKINPIAESYWPLIETKIRQSIMQRLLNTNVSIPRFERAGFYRGFLLIQCNDDNSKNLFCQAININSRLIPEKNLTTFRASRINSILERNLSGKVEAKDVKKPNNNTKAPSAKDVKKPTSGASSKDKPPHCKTSSAKDVKKPIIQASNQDNPLSKASSDKDVKKPNNEASNKNNPPCKMPSAKDGKKPTNEASKKDNPSQCKTSSAREPTKSHNEASNLNQNKPDNCQKKSNNFVPKNLNMNEQKTSLTSSQLPPYSSQLREIFQREITREIYEKCKNCLQNMENFGNFENLTRNQRRQIRRAQLKIMEYEKMHGICNDLQRSQNEFGGGSWNYGGNGMQVAGNYRENSDQDRSFFSSKVEQHTFYNTRMMANMNSMPRGNDMSGYSGNIYYNSTGNFNSNFNPDYFQSYNSNADNRNYLLNSSGPEFPANSRGAFGFDCPFSRNYEGEPNDNLNFGHNMGPSNNSGPYCQSNSANSRFSSNFRNSFDQHMNYGRQNENYSDGNFGNSFGEMRDFSSRNYFDFERMHSTETCRNYGSANEKHFNEISRPEFSGNKRNLNSSSRLYSTTTTRSGVSSNSKSSLNFEEENRNETPRNSKDYSLINKEYFKEERSGFTSNSGNRAKFAGQNLDEEEPKKEPLQTWENNEETREESCGNKRRKLSSKYENICKHLRETKPNSEVTTNSENCFPNPSQQEANRLNEQKPNTSIKADLRARIYECLSSLNKETALKTLNALKTLSAGRDLTESQAEEASPLTKLKRKLEILRKNKSDQPAAADVIVLSDDSDSEEVATSNLDKYKVYFKALDYLKKMKLCKQDSLSDAEKLQIEICRHKINKYGKLIGASCDPSVSTSQGIISPAQKTQDQQKKQTGSEASGFFIRTFTFQNSNIPNNPKSAALTQTPAPAHACETAKSHHDLRVAIIDRKQEDFKIPAEAWQKIEKSLLEHLCQELQQTNNPNIGMFDGVQWQYGIKIIQCENVESLNFIKSFIRRQHIFFPNTQFDVIPAAELPKPSIANVWLPPPLIDDQAAFRLIKAQNSMLLSNDWTLMNSREKEGGKTMYLSISSHSVERLSKQNFEIRYGTNRLKMNLSE